MANLSYYIFDGVLSGFAGGASIHVMAGSGGGAGSTRHRATDTANNPYATGVRTQGHATSTTHVHGGPIPIGRYVIHRSQKHPHLGRACYLAPDRGNAMHQRGGFYIHGTGAHGSDGCIVPIERLAFLLDRIDADGGGTLHVLETTEDCRFA